MHLRFPGRLAVAAVTVAIAVPIAASCAFAGVTSATAGPRPAPRSVPGWAFLASDAPVDGGSVRLLTVAGRVLSARTATTGSRGTFFADARRPLPQQFLVEVTGGTVNGLPFRERLLRLVTRYAGTKVVHVNPATTFSAAYAAAHPDLPYKDVVHKVKHYLGIPDHASLGESMRLSSKAFDGVALVRVAAARGGLTPYLKALVREIDSRRNAVRSFRGTRHPQLHGSAARRLADPPSFGTGVATGVLSGIGAGIGKALIGDALTAAGAGKVSDFLGLSSNGTTDSLNAISATLATITTQLGAINTAISDLSTSLTSIGNAISAEVTQGDLSTMVTTINTGIPGIASIGDPTSDVILQDLGLLVSAEQDVVTAIQADTTGSALADPAGPEHFFCNAPANLDAATKQSYANSCGVLSGAVSDAPPAGTTNILNWCSGADAPTSGNALLMCEILTRSGQYAVTGASNAAATLNSDLVGSSGGDGLVVTYAKARFATLKAGLGFLTPTNYSLPMATFATQWETRLSLLGLYVSLYDDVQSSGVKGVCTIGGVSSPTRAQCDVANANTWAANVQATVKPAIPVNMAIRTSDLRAWALVSQTQTTYCGDISNGFDSGDGAWLWGISSLLDGSLTGAVGVDCSAMYDNISISNGTSADTGWAKPSTAELQALFSGQSNPGAWLTTSLGMADLTSYQTSPAAASTNPYVTPFITGSTFRAVCQSLGADCPTYPTTSTGTSYGLWTSDCSAQASSIGYTISTSSTPYYYTLGAYDPNTTLYYYPDQPSLRSMQVQGLWCNYINLSDGTVKGECILGKDVNAPCDVPIIKNSSTFYSTGPLDFGHENALLAYRYPPAGEYWYSP